VNGVAYPFNTCQPTAANRCIVMLYCDAAAHAIWRFIVMELIFSSGVLTVLLLFGAIVDFLVTRSSQQGGLR
jgi:hypothetical protein